MHYLWIFVGVYALAFVLVNIKLSSQMSHMKVRLRENGIAQENFDAIFRQEMPAAKEFLIRIWAPFVFSIIPTGIISLGYFVFS